MRLLSLGFSIALVGCSTTPYQGDNVKHVNALSQNTISEADLKFNIGEKHRVDLRGSYSNNDTIDAVSMMYDGSAGLVGLLVQVGAQAAMLQGQRDGKLSAQQEEANKKISPLIDITNHISLVELTGDYRSKVASLDKEDSDTVNIKPVFFSNGDMNRISLNLTAWSNSLEENNRAQESLKYKNLLKIYSPKLTAAQSEALASGDRSLISDLLSSLLQTALYITKNDVTGKYSQVKNPVKTYHMEIDSGRKVIRGAYLEEKCGYQIIRDIRSWVIAYPSSADEEHKQLDDKHQCLAPL